MNESLTIDELLAEITAAVQNAEGHTTLEWAEQMGCFEGTARSKIKRLLRAGKMAHGRALRVNIKGQTITTDVYRIL